MKRALVISLKIAAAVFLGVHIFAIWSIFTFLSLASKGER